MNPFHVSYIIEFTLLKANKVSGVYRNAKNKPVIIWIIKHNPNIDPKFQNKLILIGVGKLINELLIIKINGWLIFFLKIVYFIIDRIGPVLKLVIFTTIINSNNK